MVMKECVFGMISVVLLAVAACGPSNEPELGSQSNPILDGTLVAPGDHREVVMVVDTIKSTLCSGTLIAPRVVLTAAHCFPSGTNDLSAYSVGFGTSYWEDKVLVKVAEILVHPQYESTKFTDDIALIRLAGAAPSGVKPIPHLPKSLEITSNDIGTQLEFVGFGNTSTILPGNGVKMQVNSPLKEVCTLSPICSWHSWPIYQTVSNTICVELNNGGPYGGDSGGPAFITRGNQVYVAGTTAYDDTLLFGPYYACSMKVDYYEGFINEFLKAKDGIGCSQDGECFSNHCVEEICCESSCTDSCQACNLPGSLGKCLPVPEGTTCIDSTQCDGIKTCTSGSCNCKNSNGFPNDTPSDYYNERSSSGCNQGAGSPNNLAWLAGVVFFLLYRRSSLFERRSKNIS